MTQVARTPITLAVVAACGMLAQLPGSTFAVDRVGTAPPQPPSECDASSHRAAAAEYLGVPPSSDPYIPSRADQAALLLATYVVSREGEHDILQMLVNRSYHVGTCLPHSALAASGDPRVLGCAAPPAQRWR